MECAFWEFGAVVRHEKIRHDSGLVSAAEARRTFDVPSFVTFRNRGLEQPADPRVTLADAESSARAKGWIQRDGRLNDEWYEVVTALAYSRAFATMYLASPEEPETRAMVTVGDGLGFRIVMREERVWIDEVRPDDLDRALVASLPDGPVASGGEVRLPTKVLAGAGTEAEKHEADQGDWIAYELGQAGIPAREAKAAGRMLRLGSRVTAEFNVGLRESGKRHFSPYAIVVHHSPEGRVAQIPRLPNGEQTSVTPASPPVLAEALRAYRDDLRQRLRDQR